MTVGTLVRALDRDRRLKEAYGEYVAILEETEAEAWAKYERLSRISRQVRAAHERKPPRATKTDLKIASKRAVRAHHTHQQILSEIMLTHRLWTGWKAGRG